MSTYTAIIIGTNNEEEIARKLWPYYLENKESYTYTDVTEKIINLLLNKYKLTKKELFSFNQDIFNALVKGLNFEKFTFITPNDLIGYQSTDEIQENYYIKLENGEYAFTTYSHKYPYIKWGAEIVKSEDTYFLGSFEIYMNKASFFPKISQIFNSFDHALLKRRLSSVIDINGEWHNLDDSEEYVFKILNNALENLPDNTPITFFNYYD